MIQVIVGGQYGSEGKGALIAHLARTTAYQWAVRGGGSQAGHTFWMAGKKVVRQIPVACVIGPSCRGYIGPGAVIDLEVLNEEVERFGVADRFDVHPAAAVIEPIHKKRESYAQSIPGSTREGVGACRAARALRQTLPIKDVPRGFMRFRIDRDLSVYDHMLRSAKSSGHMVMAEGAQGFGLSLWHGAYPYVTSADTTPAAVLAECGLPVLETTSIVAVVRTYPIRVAGNSGPLQNEVKWSDVGVEAEITTVTKRERRVGLWEWSEFHRMLSVVAPSEVALMFCDYVDPNVVNAATATNPPDWSLFPLVMNMVRSLRAFVRCRYIGVGGVDFRVMEVPE